VLTLVACNARFRRWASGVRQPSKGFPSIKPIQALFLEYVRCRHPLERPPVIKDTGRQGLETWLVEGMLLIYRSVGFAQRFPVCVSSLACTGCMYKHVCVYVCAVLRMTPAEVRDPCDEKFIRHKTFRYEWPSMGRTITHREQAQLW
jgi:hypothetical protein